MDITSKMVKELRDRTNAGMMDCKKALLETCCDFEKAVDFLRLKGLAVALKRADRITTEGVIVSYIHAGGKLGVLLEIGCETDFVAKTKDFHDFCKNVAMHIAAANPVTVAREDIDLELIEREKNIYQKQALDAGKPVNIVDKIVEGRIEKYVTDICLLEQAFIKNQDLTIHDLLNDLVSKMGEHIEIKRFVRYQIGI